MQQHAIGIAIDKYTESDLESRRDAVTKLELALGRQKPLELSFIILRANRAFTVNEARRVEEALTY